MSKDTTPEAQRVRLDVLASLPGEERLLEALRLSQVVADLAALGVAERAAQRSTVQPAPAH